MMTTAMNVSETESTNTSSPYQGLSRHEAIAWGAMFAAEGVLIVVGNALAVAIFSRTRQLRKRSMYLVMNLVAADLLVGALTIPSWIYTSFGRAFHGDVSPNCVFLELAFPIIDMMSSFASTGCLVALSIERSHATFRPLRHRLVTGGFYLACIISLWTLALFPIPLRLAIYYGKVKPNSLVAWLPIQLGLLLLICAAYLAIWIKIRFGRNPSQHSTERDRKLTTVLFIVAVVALFAWLPFIVLNIIYVIDPGLYHYRALYATKLLHYGNSLINPMIYPFRMPVFRRAMVRLICRAQQVRPLQGGELQTHDSVRESTY